jgi:hypothetical protein
MRLLLLVSTLLLSDAFQVPTRHHARLAPLRTTSSSSSISEADAPANSTKKPQVLGLLTFDLDDTLYPVRAVIAEANAAFVRAMNNYGFENIQNDDIDLTSKKIRQEISATDPQGAAVLTHTELRLLAIRREMENVIFKRKLQETADSWATPVASLSPVVVSHAKKYVRCLFLLLVFCRIGVCSFFAFLFFLEDGPAKPSLLPLSKRS